MELPRKVARRSHLRNHARLNVLRMISNERTARRLPERSRRGVNDKNTDKRFKGRIVDIDQENFIQFMVHTRYFTRVSLRIHNSLREAYWRESGGIQPRLLFSVYHAKVTNMQSPNKITQDIVIVRYVGGINTLSSLRVSLSGSACTDLLYSG